MRTPADHGRLNAFEDDPAVIYAVSQGLRLLYCNAAWDRFALENGGPTVVRQHQIGVDIRSVIPEPLRSFYLDAFARVRTTGEPWDHDYECSSPERFRLFHMRVTPFAWQSQRRILIVVNSLVAEGPHPGPGVDSNRAALHDEDGIVTMCCHCRRTRLPSGAREWIWVPSLVRDMPLNVSHGLCPPCFSTYRIAQ